MDNELIHLVERYPDLEPCAGDVQRARDLLVDCFQSGGKVVACGNGGSAADSEHLVGELMKGFLSPCPLPGARRAALLGTAGDDGPYLADHLQGALPAIALVSQAGLLTAIANDLGADLVFAQQVYGYGQPGDVLMPISTSGNSRSVLLVLQEAKALGLPRLDFTGRSGGALSDLCSVAIRVPYDETAVIQERHLALCHEFCAVVERTIFGAPYAQA